ncbi:hypothetical protein TYRP_018261 [Tyrophagus putrescentiae]|nr:hypothetical protein TYRP_018261 [Tyrophagus putrescentiae]
MITRMMMIIVEWAFVIEPPERVQIWDSHVLKVRISEVNCARSGGQYRLQGLVEGRGVFKEK